MDINIVDIIAKSGMGVGAFIVLCFISYSIIKHILIQSNKIMDMAIGMNREWQKVIDEHTANAKEFHDISLRAFDHIREEHKDLDNNQKELTKTLAQLNDSVGTVNRSLKETEQALGRINGYTPPH